jgi:capsular polysaccharide export protein
MEGLRWSAKYLTRGAQAAKAEAALKVIEGRSYFLFPLQLSSDYQIRVHSPFLR